MKVIGRVNPTVTLFHLFIHSFLFIFWGGGWVGKVKKSRIRVTKGLSAGIRDHAQYPHLIQLFENLCGLIIQTRAHLTPLGLPHSSRQIRPKTTPLLQTEKILFWNLENIE